MEFIKQIERLQVLNKLLKEQSTGCPEELAERLGVSRRQLYVYLSYIKDQGIKIDFSRKLNSFVYSDKKEVEIAFKFEVLDPVKSENIFGGKSLENFLPCFYYARSESKLAS